MATKEACGNCSLIFFRHFRVAADIEFAFRHFRVSGADAQYIMGILLVADDEVDVGEDLAHGLLGQFARTERGIPAPEFLAVVHVDAGPGTGLMRGLAGGDHGCGHAFRKCRRSAGQVEPVLAGEDGRPVEIVRREFGDGAAGAVVDDFGRALRSAGLDVKDAQSGAAPGHEPRIQAVLAQEIDAGITHLACGYRAYDVRLAAVIGQ